MNKLSEDIIKYKKGELSPKEMHALEKKALADPFLADALEGSEKISSKEFLNDVQSIHEKIKTKKKTVFFSPLRIAAGILVVAAVASFTVYQLIPKTERLALKTNKEKLTVKTDSQKVAAPVKPESTMQTAKQESKPSAKQPTHSIAKAKEKAKGPVETESTTTAPAKVKPVEPNTLVQVNEQPVTITLDKAPVVSQEVASGIQSVDKKADDIAEVSPKQVMAEKKEKSQLRATGAGGVVNHLVTGQVLSSTDGSPIPGVNVTLKGTTQGTVTDESGRFKLNLMQPDQSLVFSFIGFEQQEVNAGEKDQVDVNLKEDATQLSEVVVTGYGAPKDENAEPIIKLAEPVGGRKAYDKYLDDNLHYPQVALENKVKGRVVIEFTVHTDGSLDEFNVIKKLGYGCEEEVIRLVKEGPAWKPTTQDNVPVESNVRVRMKFNPEGKK